MKGQISLDFLLAIIIFAILFSVFFVFGDTILEKTDILRLDSDLSGSASNMRPLFAALDLPAGYDLKYNLECEEKSFYYQDGNYFVSDLENKQSKLVAVGELDNYFCNAAVYFNK